MNRDLTSAVIFAAGFPADSRADFQSVSGGDINAAWLVRTSHGDLFVKTNTADSLPMFQAEEKGLNELAGANAIRVPVVYGTGRTADSAWIAMEYLKLRNADSAGAEKLGHALAKLHRTTRERFGWDADNTIGLTPQINTWSADWVNFYAENRLAVQLQLARRNGFGDQIAKAGEELLANLAAYFANYSPRGSLLHGDLWGGNWGCTEDQVPVLFDPAVYFGDRETDIAMTELFGGFPRAFYDAYNESWPLDEGYPQRRTIYQLYHLLNHLNLFGAGYLGRVEQMLELAVRQI